MKKLITLPVAILFAFAVSAQTSQQIVAEAKKLRTAEQHMAALQTLNAATQFTPEIAHEIIDILISPTVYTNKYLQHFAIYEKDQNGQRTRREFDYPLFDLVRFAADTFRNNCLIRSDISRVCEKLLTFNEGFWEVSDITDIKETVEQYVQPKCPSYLSNYLIGFCNNYLGKTKEALPFLQKAVSLNASYVPALVAYANALLKSKNNETALVYAKKAWEQTRGQSRAEQSSAALVLGKVYNAMNDNANALQYLATADTLKRSDFYNLLALLDFYLKTDISKAGETANKFVASNGRTNVNYYLDVLKLYAAYNKLPELRQWCQVWMGKFLNRPEALACFNFTLGMIYKQSDPGKAKMYFAQAKSQGLKSSNYNATYIHPDAPRLIDEAYKMID